MTLQEYLKLALRHLYLITIITAVCLSVALYYNHLSQQLNVNNTIFYIFSVEDPRGQTDSYENAQAADQITESIMGWFKDPAFVSSVNAQSNLAFNLKSKKQEKNNLIITFNADNEANSKLYANSIKKTLSTYLFNFNNNSDLVINISSEQHTSNPRNNEAPLFALIGLLMGVIMGYLSALIYEIVTARLKSTSEIANIFPEIQTFTFRSHKHFKIKHQLLLKVLEKDFEGKDLQLLDFTSMSKTGLESLSKREKINRLISLDLPDQIEKVETHLPTLLIVELGKTSITQLKMLALLKPCCPYVITLDHQ